VKQLTGLKAMAFLLPIADARFAKPLDMDLIDQLAINHKALLIVEEGSPGGFSAHVMTYLGNAGHLDGGLKARALCLPDVFIDHDSQQGQLAFAGVDCDGIYAAARKVILKPSAKTACAKVQENLGWQIINLSDCAAMRGINHDRIIGFGQITKNRAR
jgi:1-deoxy-D-xylulose-5-phosphate synthase